MGKTLPGWSNLAFRSFYGIKELNRSDGFPTNMIHGWLRTFGNLKIV